MPHRYQTGSGGIVFHVMNRAARRGQLFFGPSDYAAFLDALRLAGQRSAMRLLCYVVMPNHWHLMLWPVADQDLSSYMQWLTRTHAQRWHAAHDSTGTGAVYQGRFKAIPIQTDRHFLVVCRYVERNPVRAHLVPSAREWRWGSAWDGPPAESQPDLAPWPVSRPANWSDWVEQPEKQSVVKGLRERIQRGRPFGCREWGCQTAARLRLEPHLRGAGRPAHCAVVTGGCEIRPDH